SASFPLVSDLILPLLTAAVHTQPVLTQQPSVFVAPGESITLKCVMAEAKFKDYCNGAPDRFSGSRDNSLDEGYLNISCVQSEDEADYYCSVLDNTHKVHSDTGLQGTRA
uniref:Ig-like domain-containing protein n=1 Tax=Crocodylus porosus TaxID=8502 RepID=A0A7M4DZE8_CROPO